MRRVAMFGAVLALIVLSLGGVAVAKGQGKGHGKGQGHGGGKVSTFVFKGTVVEASDDSVLVEVEGGNRKARAFVGRQVSFGVMESTMVERDDAPISATELLPEEEVTVQSKAPAGSTEFTARKISSETEADETDSEATS